MLRLKQGTLLLLTPFFFLTGCSNPKVENERIYLGIAAISDADRKSSRLLIRNAINPISSNLLERKLPYYLHVEDLGRDTPYYSLYENKPTPQDLLKNLDGGLLKLVSTPNTPRLQAVTEGLKRVRAIINQDSSKGKIRASLVVSGFDIAKLKESELEEIKSVSSDMSKLSDRISMICILGISGNPSRTKLAGLFHTMRDKFFIPSNELDSSFDKCLRQ